MSDEVRARRYHRLHLLLGAAGLLLAAAYLVGLLVLGAGRHLAAAAARVCPAGAFEVAVVAAALALGYRLITLPLGWMRGYWLPKRYGLLHQPFGAWLKDGLKAAAIGGAFALLGVEIVYALLGATRLWWLVAAAVFLLLQAFIAFVVPVWLMPLFYRLTPLADASLRARLVRLAERAGVRVVGVWVADQSRKSRTANAMLTGLGRTRRIVLFDTLVDGFSVAETEAVLAHELGHHAHHDIWRGLAGQGVLIVVTFTVADRLLQLGAPLWNLRGIEDPAGVPWLALVLLGLGLLTLPLANAFSRRIEREADDFALAATGDAAGFIRAMERLASLNLAERRPHRLKEIVFYSHPAIDRRIARAIAWRRRAGGIGATAPRGGAV